jgi:hypothetical protein
MATKIETDLTPEELMEFFRRVAQTKGGATGPRIQALASEFGVTISHETANEYRKGIVSRELERLRRNAEKSKEIVETVKAGVGISDANAVRLQMVISDKLDELVPGQTSPKDLAAMTSANEQLRTGDRNAKRLEADLKIATARLHESSKKIKYADERIAVLERARTQWEEQRKQIAAATQKARKAVAKSPDDVRSAAVAEIDRIMGIKAK